VLRNALPPEERLKGLTPEEILEGLEIEEIEDYLGFTRPYRK
jgi:hypothetical protein